MYGFIYKKNVYVYIRCNRLNADMKIIIFLSIQFIINLMAKQLFNLKIL